MIEICLVIVFVVLKASEEDVIKLLREKHISNISHFRGRVTLKTRSILFSKQNFMFENLGFIRKLSGL